MRTRLLVLSSTYPRWKGDPEPGFVHEISKRLAERMDVTVLAPHAPGALLREELDGVTVVRYRYGPAAWETLVNDGGILGNLKRNKLKWLLLPGFFLGQLLAVRRLLGEFRPDVIHAHWLVPQGLVLALLGSIDRRVPPWVVTSHGADLFALRGRLMTWLKRKVLRLAHGATVVSSAMVPGMLGAGARPDRLWVESMGVDLVDRFRVDGSQPRSSDRLLFVGRLVEKKGLVHLLDALPSIRASRPRVTLDIIGFGPEEPALRVRADQLGLDGVVEFHGAVGNDRLPDHYRRAAAFVAPFVMAADGDQEGLGLVLVEAAGCGCPVVAGDVPAVRDVVDQPVIGEVVPAGDPAKLAEAVLKVLDSQSSDSDEARARAVARFDWSHRARAYAEILEAAARPAG